MTKQKNIYPLLVLAAALLFSFGGFLIKLTPWNPLAVSSGRSLVAALEILIYMKLRGHKPVLNKAVLIGGAAKVIANYNLVAIPGIHIYGAPIASLSCYTISMLPNLYYVSKYTGMKLDLWNIAGRPALATAIMALVLLGSMRLLPTHGVWTLVQVVIGVAVYAGAALMTGAITREEAAPILRRFRRKAAPKKEEN